MIWAVAQEGRGPYDYLVRFILLTATRLREASDMRRAELNGCDWLIPGARYKTKLDHLIPLSKAAQSLLAEMPTVGGSAFEALAALLDRIVHPQDNVVELRGA